MNVVEIYSKPDCHLCDVAKEALREAQKASPFELKEIILHEGDEKFEQYSGRVPVILINGTFAFQFRVTAQELLKRLGDSARGAK